MGVVGQPHNPAASTPGKHPLPVVQEAGWASGPVLTGGKFRPHRDSIPDRPARGQSLYRLSYPAHNLRFYTYKILVAFWNQGAAGSLSVRNSGMTFFSVKYISRQDFVRSRLLRLSTIHRSILSSSVNIYKDNNYNNMTYYDHYTN